MFKDKIRRWPCSWDLFPQSFSSPIDASALPDEVAPAHSGFLLESAETLQQGHLSAYNPLGQPTGVVLRCFYDQTPTLGAPLHLPKGNSLHLPCPVLSQLSMIRITGSVADLWKEVTESNSRSKLFGLWQQQLINQSHCFPSDTAECRGLRNDRDITTLCLC